MHETEEIEEKARKVEMYGGGLETDQQRPAKWLGRDGGGGGGGEGSGDGGGVWRRRKRNGNLGGRNGEAKYGVGARLSAGRS
eukprot:765526-Hanusia_phi.AAC.4